MRSLRFRAAIMVARCERVVQRIFGDRANTLVLQAANAIYAFGFRARTMLVEDEVNIPPGSRAPPALQLFPRSIKNIAVA